MTPTLQAAVAELAAEFDLGVGHAVVDLGAGSGKRARLLADTGARVIAIEPSAAMRAQLAASIATVEIVDGSADGIPLPEWTADLVVVADPGVWLGSDEAVAEVHRVVRPEGGLAVIGDLPLSAQARLGEGFTATQGLEFVHWCRKCPLPTDPPRT